MPRNTPNKIGLSSSVNSSFTLDETVEISESRVAEKRGPWASPKKQDDHIE